ncbi:MAG: amidohydrolase family protein, partial [Bacteroidetes bacterium]|nr:amidohydrolase family protein [Bacteroidota bacterium]
MKQTFSGKIVDVRNRKIFKGKVAVEQGIIQSVTPCELRNGEDKGYIMPGFIDAHIHIESSMLIPAEFARWAIYQGTVASVSDPHEIANVIGEEGVDFMIENGRTVPFKFFFGAPSCVPATQFETAGAALPSSSIKKLLQREDIKYLAEMMNWPGVLQKEPEVLAKIQVAKDLNKVVDGHAPGLRGRQAIDYFSMGISTDHECTAYREAIEKIKAGAKIAIREGSAAKNFEALHPLFLKYPQALMLCSDDKHPDDLMEGHINKLVIRALKKGYALFDVLYAACIQPIDHYGLEVGALQPGDPADFIRVENLRDFTLNDVFIDGKQVLHSSQLLFD